MKLVRQVIWLFIILALVPAFVMAQGKEKKDVYEFEMIKELKTTPVKNQGKTGTCWSFATTSFVETELIRMGKGEHILSPMFNVRYVYPQKAVKFVRYSGSSNFGPGGQAHDAINVIKEFGMIPEEIYSGKNIGEEEHNHGEMDAVLKATIDAVSKNKGGKITPRWKEVIEAELDIYLGAIPKEFLYQGKKYTPKSFAESLGFNPNDYVELTSYTHHPFYKKVNLEMPDNWSNDLYYNIPVDELMRVMENAIMNGFSVDWDGDVSEKYFNRKKSVSIYPLVEEVPAEDAKKDEEKDKVELPEKEKFVTQEIRQQAFDNQTTTDDHLMHLTALAKDQTGNKYYYTKNSWGTKDRKYAGYWYMSEQYIRAKTTAIMVHKDAIPEDIKAKLGL